MTSSQFPPYVSEFVVKVASRCNLNCRYCYMYNLEDTTWRNQPKFMSVEIFSAFLQKLRRHVSDHNVLGVNLILHGGEPLLMGATRIDELFTLARTTLEGTIVGLGMQSNGLLLTPEIGKVLRKHDANVGISIDGIPGKGDLNRINHQGRAMGKELETCIRKFLADGFKDQFGGFISVIDPKQDPVETFRYLASFEPPSIDFRFPLTHHDSITNSVMHRQDGTFASFFEK